MSAHERETGHSTAAGDATPYRYSFHHRVPDEFVRLPDPIHSDGWREAMTELLPGAGDEERKAVSDGLRDQLPLLASRENNVLTAMCAGTEDVGGEERLSMGLLAVTVRPSDHTPSTRVLAAEGIYQAMVRKAFSSVPGTDLEELNFTLGEGLQGPEDMVLAAKLPCGPAVMSTALRSLRFPTPEPSLSTPPLPVAVLELVVPAPHSYCVCVTISTPSVFLLDSYSARLAHIGRSLRFTDMPETTD